MPADVSSRYKLTTRWPLPSFRSRHRQKRKLLLRSLAPTCADCIEDADPCRLQYGREDRPCRKHSIVARLPSACCDCTVCCRLMLRGTQRRQDSSCRAGWLVFDLSMLVSALGLQNWEGAGSSCQDLRSLSATQPYLSSRLAGVPPPISALRGNQGTRPSFASFAASLDFAPCDVECRCKFGVLTVGIAAPLLISASSLSPTSARCYSSLPRCVPGLRVSE